ncbi:response regulator transcription factor [Cryptosporangium phraense]|uniref:Response regulator transcription factor n=1 Tax=Cryptosporangium phraense TaxID=2593070 RepID=A0A545AVK3_9ACTN|nr:response regulator transcription factor [Cryptosporangium phraense]TQS45311.1 response regulator transcription factor [Cryptosporangium phraense]
MSITYPEAVVVGELQSVTRSVSTASRPVPSGWCSLPDTAGLLLVEDDPVIGPTLRRALAAQGYTVAWETTGRGALSAAVRTPPDLVLVDLGLPDLDGLEVTRRLRATVPNAVVVILSARTDEIDVVVGLEAGADDYLTKPFRLAELLARLRAHIRRGGAAQRVGQDAYQVGHLTIDRAARRCTLGETEVALRAREFDLLTRLIASAGEAVRRETLMADVWDENWFGSTKTLDVHVAAVRRRLGDAEQIAGVRAPILTTLRGHGYRLEREEFAGRLPPPERPIAGRLLASDPRTESEPRRRSS